jgi:hypothetical protein
MEKLASQNIYSVEQAKCTTRGVFIADEEKKTVKIKM